MFLGILTGLAAAFFQSLCYLATRHYVQSRPAGSGASRQLLVLAHVCMGVFALILLPFVWRGTLSDLRSVCWPLVNSSLCYLTAQFALVIALKHTEPSRVSPLLGFKIIVLAILASFLVQPHPPGTPAPPIGLTWMQWLAAILCAIAAIALNFSGAALRRRAILAIIIACIGYSFSDWNITLLVNAVQKFTSPAVAFFLSTTLSYIFSGLIALCFLPFHGSWKPADWRDSIPFAACWFIAMLFLFTCFGTIGPLLGNILQSSRGLISILLGSLLVYWGHHHIEPLHGKGVFIRRLAAGILMFLAVSLYVIRDPSNLTMKRHDQGTQPSHGALNDPGETTTPSLPGSGPLARSADPPLRL